MYSATAYKIRDARVEDVPELVRLGWATADHWPRGHILVGELHGVVAAALAVEENRAVMAKMPGAQRLLARLRARAAGIQAYHRTPSVADRFREQMRRRLMVSA
jgi:hypothetical protein